MHPGLRSSNRPDPFGNGIRSCQEHDPAGENGRSLKTPNVENKTAPLKSVAIPAGIEVLNRKGNAN